MDIHAIPPPQIHLIHLRRSNLTTMVLMLKLVQLCRGFGRKPVETHQQVFFGFLGSLVLDRPVFVHLSAFSHQLTYPRKRLGFDDVVHFDFVDPPSPEAKGYEKCWAVAVSSQHLFETFLAQQLNQNAFHLDKQIQRCGDFVESYGIWDRKNIQS